MCCGKCKVPCGRSLSFFDADIIEDIEAYQKLCQICCTEGSLYLLRQAGADLDDPSPRFAIHDVPNDGPTHRRAWVR